MFLILWLLPLSLVLTGIVLRVWYFQQVNGSRAQVHHLDGRTVPGERPKMLVGNLVEVYQSKNRLSAYHAFHEKFGEIVQIFWMWRQQISVTNYQMAQQILVSHQQNYQKFTPNALLQRLYGSSVLTTDGETWKQHRLLIQAVFSRKHVPKFHPIFVSLAEQLATQWEDAIAPNESASIDVYPDLMALFLDIVGKTAIGHDFGALRGQANQLLGHLTYVISQSTRPVHQFTSWWKFLPLPSNRRLNQAFAEIDQYLYELIRQRRSQASSEPVAANVLDLLLRATDLVEEDVPALSDQEVRDNLLAIMLNGYETVAVSLSMSLYLLAQHPEQLAQAQAEVDRVMAAGTEQLSEVHLSDLHYLEGILLESLRLYPPMAGLQRISLDRDNLEGWSIPENQVVAITLTPLHQNAQYFGDAPEQFCPQRYFEENRPVTQPSSQDESRGQCPLKWFSNSAQASLRANTGVCLPLTFGDGARRCLGEHFALYEMKVVLAVLLHRFNFEVASNFTIDPELSKFGLFISMFPKGGVHLKISHRHHHL